jgi:hypothetical protein
MRASVRQRLIVRQSLLSACAFSTPFVLASGVLASGLFGARALGAQTTQVQQAPSVSHATAHRKAHTTAARPAVVAEPAAPASPPTPNWPINSRPAPASVVWSNGGLRIDATNSSLQQILSDVSTATGTKVEGLNEDQRVFGEFGPGQARDVLSQLLAGYGFNVLIIGDQGQGVPRQIVLSVRHTVGAPPVAANSAQDESDDDIPDPQVDTQPQPPPVPQPARPPGFGQDGQVRTPQQLMQEIQQRQQQLQQQQGQPAANPTAPNQ